MSEQRTTTRQTRPDQYLSPTPPRYDYQEPASATQYAGLNAQARPADPAPFKVENLHWPHRD